MTNSPADTPSRATDQARQGAASAGQICDAPPGRDTPSRRSADDQAAIRAATSRLWKTFGWNEPLAFSVLRSASMRQHRPIPNVARDVLGAEDPAQVLRLPGSEFPTTPRINRKN